MNLTVVLALLAAAIVAGVFIFLASDIK